MSDFTEINNVINLIKNSEETFKKFTEFPLKKYFSIDDKAKNLLIDLNKISNFKAYYNKNTLSFNGINVIDIDNERIIEFYDDMSDMINKGLDFSELGDNFN
tara:strand:- start:955 stop:1260 length:306 start_codon:yes stop_codon:yes gene_type:complete